jgi:hypothetical protein
MRPDESPTFEDDRHLDPCDDAQVQRWAADYGVPPEEIREACQQVGGNRTAVELKLTAPRD